MEKEKDRLHSLDGLRGIAILFVFLNHLTPKYLIAAFPILDQIGIFSSGIAGVSFLFIISGFLMSFLYPSPQKKFYFLQKRYTRIFPLFLTMCAAMLVFALYPTLAWWMRIGTIVFLALLAHVIWVYIIKKIPFSFFPKVLFFGFFFLQILVGGFYFLFILKQPPLVLQQYPPLLHNSIIGLVNATLTFPLGNYIPMLDGVYWSLGAEILFYVLYPFFIVPLVAYLAPQKRFVKVLFLLSLLPFFGGVDILSHYIFSLSTLQLSLFYYFPFGIMLGYLYRKHPHFFTRFSQFFKGPLTYIPILLFILVLIGQHQISALLPSSFSTWIRLFSAFPFAAIVAVAIDKKTSLYKLLSTKTLVFMGMISYSLYLSHSAVVHMAEDYHRSGSLQEDIYTLLITLLISIALSSLLYFLLERPYFNKTKQLAPKPNTFPIIQGNYIWSKTVWAGMGILYLFAIFLAFQSSLNLSSFITPQSSNAFLNNTTNPISLQTNSITKIKIAATENNLGIIYLSVKHIKTSQDVPDVPQLVFTLQEEGNTKPIASLPYVLDEFRGEDFPFGFPVIPHSQGKTYIASFALVPPSNDNFATFDTHSLKTVYALDKKSLVKDPRLALRIIINKFQNVFSNQLTLISFMLLLPFFGLGLFLFFLPSKKLTQK